MQSSNEITGASPSKRSPNSLVRKLKNVKPPVQAG
jgi:hypothetical protein